MDLFLIILQQAAWLYFFIGVVIRFLTLLDLKFQVWEDDVLMVGQPGIRWYHLLIGRIYFTGLIILTWPLQFKDL